MPKPLRFRVWLILHTILAILGAASLENALGQAFHPHSLAAMLWKEWILSLVGAALIGFFMWRKWGGSAAMWVWVLPGLWFAFVSLVSLRQSLWGRLSGTACSGGFHMRGCVMFFVSTIPFVRGVSYSVGAGLCLWVSKTRPQPASESRSEPRQSAS